MLNREGNYSLSCCYGSREKSIQMAQIIIDQQNGELAFRLERFVDLSELGHKHSTIGHINVGEALKSSWSMGQAKHSSICILTTYLIGFFLIS